MFLFAVDSCGYTGHGLARPPCDSSAGDLSIVLLFSVSPVSFSVYSFVIPCHLCSIHCYKRASAHRLAQKFNKKSNRVPSESEVTVCGCHIRHAAAQDHEHTPQTGGPASGSIYCTFDGLTTCSYRAPSGRRDASTAWVVQIRITCAQNRASVRWRERGQRHMDSGAMAPCTGSASGHLSTEE